MIHSTFKTLLFCKSLNNHNFGLIRYVRSIARRNDGPKLVEGKVKTVTYFDEPERIESYKDFIDNIEKSKLGDELEVEKHFLEEDYLGHVFERSDQFYDMHLREEKFLKSNIKKGIIKRKYFKLDKETNLLTYAAKEQIRFLHKTDPLEWNSKAISECFPISETGAKKLLKCTFKLTSPEKIEKHDKEVAERWKNLKSGKILNSVAPLTQKLYKEGKLVDDYFSGNPNLPTTPPTKNVIHVEKRKNVGEFSAIVQTYVTYQKQKLLESTKENCSENQLTLKDNSNVETHKKINVKDVRKLKYAHKEFDEDNYQANSFPRKDAMDHADLPLSQFKEILKEEIEFKPSDKNMYMDILSNTSKSKKSFKNANDPQNCFLKIEKYEKNNIKAVYDIESGVKRIYKYDEKLGYQYPTGKMFKGNIQIPPKLYKKGRLYKVRQCVYDDNGKFLYKVPT